MISRRTIISGSNRPIFAIFSSNESVLGADDRSGPLFSAISMNLNAMATNIVKKNGKLPFFVSLAYLLLVFYNDSRSGWNRYRVTSRRACGQLNGEVATQVVYING